MISHVPVIFRNILSARFQPFEISYERRIRDFGFAGKEQVLPDRFVVRAGRFDVQTIAPIVLTLQTNARFCWKSSLKQFRNKDFKVMIVLEIRTIILFNILDIRTIILLTVLILNIRNQICTCLVELHVFF